MRGSARWKFQYNILNILPYQTFLSCNFFYSSDITSFDIWIKIFLLLFIIRHFLSSSFFQELNTKMIFIYVVLLSFQHAFLVIQPIPKYYSQPISVYLQTNPGAVTDMSALSCPSCNQMIHRKSNGCIRGKLIFSSGSFNQQYLQLQQGFRCIKFMEGYEQSSFPQFPFSYFVSFILFRTYLPFWIFLFFLSLPLCY